MINSEVGDRVHKSARELLAIYPEPTTYPKEFVRAVERKKRAIAFLAANHSQPAPIEFLGCFDTVAALGLPFRAANDIANLIPGLQHKYHDFSLCKNVRHAYHALAIDDERKPFKPVAWTLPKNTEEDGDATHECDSPGCDERKRQRLRQVWFTGMHTDVGGGYPHDGLSNITLAWMLRQVHNHGLLLDTHQLDTHQLDACQEKAIIENHADVMHDSRSTYLTKLLYRVQQRDMKDFDPEEKPLVHESVLLRMKAPEITELKDGKEKKLPGTSYKPWVINGNVDSKKESFEIEPWVLYDRMELHADQEARWGAWLSKTEKNERKRRTKIEKVSGTELSDDCLFNREDRWDALATGRVKDID